MTWKAINDTKRHQKSNTMTTIANVRALLEEIVELFDSAISARYPHEILRDIRAALATPATAPEQCWCDEHDIGEPGVPCGDCPMQDYKPPATAPAQPAWHDAPTVPGLWVSDFSWMAQKLGRETVEFYAKNRSIPSRRWYGPIPEETP